MNAYKSELEDTNKILHKLKISSKKGYFFSHSMHPFNGADVHPIRYSVTVKHGSNSRVYEGGHGLSWLQDFEDGLKAGRL